MWVCSLCSEGGGGAFGEWEGGNGSGERAGCRDARTEACFDGYLSIVTRGGYKVLRGKDVVGTREKIVTSRAWSVIRHEFHAWEDVEGSVLQRKSWDREVEVSFDDNQCLEYNRA